MTPPSSVQRHYREKKVSNSNLLSRSIHFHHYRKLHLHLSLSINTSFYSFKSPIFKTNFPSLIDLKYPFYDFYRRLLYLSLNSLFPLFLFVLNWKNCLTVFNLERILPSVGKVSWMTIRSILNALKIILLFHLFLKNQSTYYHRQK